MRIRPVLLLVTVPLAAASLVLASCTSPSQPSSGKTPCTHRGAAAGAPCVSPSAGAVPQFKHVVVVTFDNMSYSQVIGSKSAPYFNMLADGGASFTQSFTPTSASQPNDLALFSGSTQGVTDNSCPHTFGTANLGSGLVGAGQAFTGYAESLPAAGPGTCTSGSYTRAHVPWSNFSNVPASATKDFSAFPQTSGSNFDALPAVSFVTPNACHGMSTCGIGTGNAWLQNRLGAYAQWALTHQSLLVVTFGSDNGSGANHIPTIFYGDQVKPGQYGEQVSPYNVLRTIEDSYGLPQDGQAASATPITDVWNGSTASPSPSTSSPSPSTTSPSPSATATSPPPGEPTAPAPASGIPQVKHVVVVIFENHGYGQVMGSSSAPYFNQLAGQGANLTHFAAETHPSQPNYLDLFSGSNQGVTNDSCPHTFSTANMASGLIGAGLTFGAYVDALPASGPSVCTSGNYARKHSPWANFTNVPSSVTKNFTAFPQTAGGNFAALPTISYVIPDLCNDMHNCSVATGDAWLKAHLSAYATWAMSNNSLLIVTFDENNNIAGNIIPTFFVGDDVKPGTYAQSVNHYNLLRTLEDAYGLPRNGAAASAAPITDTWIYDTG